MFSQTRNSVLILLTALSVIAASIPASSSSPYTSNGIEVGVGLTGSVPNIKIEVETSSAGVTLSYLVQNAINNFGGTSLGSVSVSAVVAFKVATGPSENIYAVGTNKNAVDDTGVATESAGIATLLSSPPDLSANPIVFSPNFAPLRHYTGSAILCLRLEYYYDSSQNKADLWHCTSPFTWPGTAQSQQNNNQFMPPPQQDEAAPAKYSGPEFSGLAGMGIMSGSTGKLEGKRLNEISSIEIGGKAATFTATSHEELELSLPAGLAPGLYDLVINSSAGKLTHINAIQVRAPKQSFSITTRSTGKISNDQYIEHSLIAAMQIPELNKARCVVNANSIAMARAMANRLCAVVKASNPNIETTVVEPRSSVKGDAVFARVSYGWN
jgi:hypothetical protein